MKKSSLIAFVHPYMMGVYIYNKVFGIICCGIALIIDGGRCSYRKKCLSKADAKATLAFFRLDDITQTVPTLAQH